MRLDLGLDDLETDLGDLDNDLHELPDMNSSSKQVSKSWHKFGPAF